MQQNLIILIFLLLYVVYVELLKCRLNYSIELKRIVCLKNCYAGARKINSTALYIPSLVMEEKCQRW